MVKTNTKKVAKNENKGKREYGYMYIGHLPHGFYEEEIKSYFSQFGRVMRVRLAHSKLTGNPKGYGFIQFENKEVAQIAAETMNNYLMFNKLLKCHLIPREKLHPETFKNAKKKFFKPLRCMFRKKYNKKRTEDQLKKAKERQNENLKKRQEKLKELGINIDLNELLNSKIKPAKIEKIQVKTKEVPKKEVKQPIERKTEPKKQEVKQIKKEESKEKKIFQVKDTQKRKSEPIKEEKEAKLKKVIHQAPEKKVPVNKNQKVKAKK